MPVSCLCVLILLVLPARSIAVALPSETWPVITLASAIEGLRLPVQLTHAGDGSGRLFLVEQAGRVLIARNGKVTDRAFLDIRSKVRCCGERGLLGIAFPPDFTHVNHFYVNYTDMQGNTVIARYRLSPDPDVADPATEEVLLTIAQPYANHNGGQIAFGPRDGFLYIGTGDGGFAGDPGNRAQNPAELLGKLLRIDVESPVQPYAVPPTNPFTTTVSYRPEIWALGLRNPWRFAFDRVTGDLYVGDVGQGSWEEIDFQPAHSTGGENYGWRVMEGAHCYNAATCDRTGLTLPVAEYDHSLGCSVSGGMVYRGSQYTRLAGIYVYGDYCSGRIWGLRRQGDAWQNALLLDTPYRITAFGEDESGALYVIDYGAGTAYRMIAASFYLPVLLQ